ncbi:MAG: hypothetical protein ACKVS6_01900, partial [Planctomycetota bacterium]
MSKKFNLLFLPALALAAMACAAHPPGIVHIVNDDPEAAAIAKSVMLDVEKIRGLQFREEVKKSFLTKEQLSEYFEADYKEEFDPEMERAAQISMELFGLIPEGYDLIDSAKNLIVSEVVGFYDARRKQLFLMKGSAEEAKGVMAHELCHALDDQFYNLNAVDEALEAAAPNNSDRIFAWGAVCEGSAMVITVQYEMKDGLVGASSFAEFFAQMREDESDETTDDADAEELDISNSEEDSNSLDHVPDALTRPMIERYYSGANFLNRGRGIAARPSKADVERAFLDPPLSSEQVLHPEKYWDDTKRDDPRIVELPDLTNMLGENWKRIGNDVLGELGVAILTTDPDDAPVTFDERMQQWLAVSSTLESEGWDGDRFDIYEKVGNGADTNENAALVVWASVWDSETDAKQIAAGLPRRAGVEIHTVQ